MKHVSHNAEKDRSGLFLGTILAALVVMMVALVLATAHSFAGRMPVSVNQSPTSWRQPLLHRASLCVVDRSVVSDRCGTKLSADH